MSVTKKGKTVVVYSQEIMSHIYRYTCPSCHSLFMGVSISKDTIRFRCSCGQELIIEKIEKLNSQ
jgi:hypothetical protein